MRYYYNDPKFCDEAQLRHKRLKNLTKIIPLIRSRSKIRAQAVCSGDHLSNH